MRHSISPSTQMLARLPAATVPLRCWSGVPLTCVRAFTRERLLAKVQHRSKILFGRQRLRILFIKQSTDRSVQWLHSVGLWSATWQRRRTNFGCGAQSCFPKRIAGRNCLSLPRRSRVYAIRRYALPSLWADERQYSWF